jgi:uncharacterized protein (DUF2147 family)
MKKLVLAAAILMASVSAQAGNSISFNVEGHKVSIHVPGNCLSLSCISVSAPGFGSDDDNDSAAPAARTAAKAAPTPAPAPAATAPAPTAPAPVTVASANSGITPAPAPSAQAGPAATAPATQLAMASPTAEVQQSAAQAPAAMQAANTPVGIWMTEKNEGKVRIEACGVNLCGYSVDARTNANAEQVLINMKPQDSKWSGRIHDTRSGGTYDSTIAMKGDDKLRVQGCALGGLFCGGQTWSRMQ